MDQNIQVTRKTDQKDGLTLGDLIQVNGWRKERMSHPEFNEKYCEPAPDERVLAECRAKRAIVADHEETMINGASWGCKVDSYRPGKCPTLRTLAAVYKDHPDYRQEWAL